MDLSIIVLSYNTKQLLSECLNSIYSNLSVSNLEIIVVDNASIDGSSEMILEKFPKVKLIVSKTNLGFAKGINLGAKKALADYLLFLNSDIQLKDKNIINMLNFIKTETNVGIVGGILLNTDGTKQRSYGRFYNIPAVLLMLTGGDRVERILFSANKEKQVDWVSGGFMMISRNNFDKLGGFDENYFMYMEDMDLCYRAKMLGINTYVLPGAKAIHLHQGSSNRSFAVKHIYKGLLYFYRKHKSYPEYRILKTVLTLKAKLATVIGTVSHKKYLVDTYKNI
jgi:GT2 family glycosyltransferase